jgi:chromosome partitioning protein
MRTGGANPKLFIEGIVMTMYSRTKLADEVVEQVRSHYGDLVYGTVVPRSVRAGEAPSFGLPVVAYAPSSSVSEGYFNFGAEFLDRFNLRASLDRKVDLPPQPASSNLA